MKKSGTPPFTTPSPPHGGGLDLLEEAPDKVRSRAYDLVSNGTEIGGGSYSNPSAGHPGTDNQCSGNFQRGGRGKIRFSPGGPAVWCSPARWNRFRDRPPHHALQRKQFTFGIDRVPEKTESHMPHEWGAFRSGYQTASGTLHQGGKPTKD